MSVGQKLKQARKEQNISLRQVADETKIGMLFLDAMERDDIESLPGGVYGRSFFRSYIRFLGLDEESLMDEYHRQFDIVPLAEAYEDENVKDNERFLRRRRNLTLLMGVIFCILVLTSLWLLRSYTAASKEIHSPKRESSPSHISSVAQDPSVALFLDQDDMNEAATEDLIPPSGQFDADLTTDELSTDAPSDAPSLPCNDPLIMTPADGNPVDRIEDLFAIQALEPVWIEVQTDGRSITRRLMEIGEVRFYRYGRVNRINIGDISKIAVQDGRTFRQRISTLPAYPGWIEFGPGEFVDRLEKISDSFKR